MAQAPALTGEQAVAAKARIIAYAKKKGALVAGVASVEDIERVAPPGHRPTDVLRNCRSVISIGVGGPSAGDWTAPAKYLAFTGGSESMAYKVAYGLAYFIESNFGYRSMFCPPDSDPESGTRVPLQSLKLHAELAGIGARSLAGDILLHPEFGLIYIASTLTELPLPPDEPLSENPCPAPSCVTMYRQTGQTPCQKFCPVQCLQGTIAADGKVETMVYEMYKCAQMSQQYEAIPHLLRRVVAETDPLERELLLHGPEGQELFYKLAIGAGELLAQCFECMRVCPGARNAPGADPVKRFHRQMQP